MSKVFTELSTDAEIQAAYDAEGFAADIAEIDAEIEHLNQSIFGDRIEYLKEERAVMAELLADLLDEQGRKLN